MPAIHPGLDWRNLTPDPGHFHFGYYDRCPFDADNRLHLALRFPQQDRNPAPGETAEVGLIDVASRTFSKVAETRAWCHQVSALMTWIRDQPGRFVFADMAGDQPLTRIYDVTTGHLGDLPCHLYNLSPDGRWGGGFDFGRIPRLGYTFADVAAQPREPWPDIDRDGIFVFDLHSGAGACAVTYRQMIEMHPLRYGLEGRHLWLNQANFNCDSTRAMTMLRSCASTTEFWPWTTDLFTYNVDGGDLAYALPQCYWHQAISHQIWGRTSREILVDANWWHQGSQYVVFADGELPVRGHKLSDGLGPAGHLNFSPDGLWLAADTYAHEQQQTLALVKVATGEVQVIGRFAHAQSNGDQRCDLHPRWSADSRWLSVDTIHDGERKIYCLDTEAGARDLFST